MERRVGQHHAQPGVPGRHLRRDRSAGAPGQQQDRGLGAGEQVGGRRRYLAEGSELLQVGGHQGQRLVGPPLAPPQPLHRAGARRVDHQVEAPEPLDGDDLAAAQGRRGRHQGLVAFR